MPSPPPDSSDFKEQFYRGFQAETSTLQNQISALLTLPQGPELTRSVEAILTTLSTLNRRVQDASTVLPPYDQRTYSSTLRSLSDTLARTRASLAPKPKFAFKRRAPAAEAPSNPLAHLPNHGAASTPSAPAALSAPAFDETTDTESILIGQINAALRAPPGSSPVIPVATAGATRRPSFSGARAVVIKGQEVLHIALSPESTALGRGTVEGLDRCVVDLSAPTRAGEASFAGLAIGDVKGSVVVTGRVGGAVHVTGMRDSVLITRCRQLRMHECVRVDVYLVVSSRPIIEDCEGVRFAPVGGAVVGGGDDQVVNQWDQVDDFKWLKAGTNPHWSKLPDDERITDGVWERAISTESVTSVDEILGMVLRH
ncbi:TBCC-domain-containing protein [Trichodelitschia bisporula]|uniref:TBCC-domain-containing protein n=1 Tax=Trichodelitschia bisporula TaxID=703511 RepID=A0A6G1HVF1_9PEZI|nr:TBCC-domain-containing protein [Trichodelitschia bisporula]